MNETLKAFAQDSAMALDAADRATIRIGYGRWPYGNGVMQSFDRTGAETVCAELAQAAANGDPGIPVYQGHPDVPEFAAHYPDKAAVGWIRSAEAAPDALVCRVEWLRDPGQGFAWFSPFWSGPVAGATMAVARLLSLGLTNNPNIKDFRLANEAAEDKPEGDKMDRAKLIQLLHLPETATDEDIAAAITKLQGDAANAATQAEAARAEANEVKDKADKAEKACANERAARVGLILDGAIAAGIITPAARPAWQKRLADDIDGGSLALANERPALKTSPASKNLAPTDSGAAFRACKTPEERVACILKHS